MSKRHEVQARIEALNEIHTIMESMKNLALMETRKLAHYHSAQQRVVNSISYALNTVRRHFACETASPDAATPVYLLFGAERGFCGAYNQQLVDVLVQQPNHLQAPLIGVGARLAEPLLRDHPHAVCLPGATVADETETVLAAVAQTFSQLQQEQGPLRLEVIHFQPDQHEPHCQPALPPLNAVTDQGLPPLINLPPPQLLDELLEHYLFASTHAWLFAALMAENQKRMQHLDQAGHHIERQVDDLGKRRNTLRQEEIIEEIEVILLSSGMVGAPGGY